MNLYNLEMLKELFRFSAGLPEMYKSELELVGTIKTKPAKEAKKSIFGLTLLGKELFAVCERSSQVEVYESTDYSFSCSLIFKELIDPWNITSCKTNNCLFIFDFKGYNQLNYIMRVKPNGDIITKWSTGYDHGWGLSVTNELNVILTILLRNKLIEYSPVGEVVREISLSSEAGIHCPLHATKLADGNFIITHGGSTDKDIYGVCIVDAGGQLKTSVNLESHNIGQLNNPKHLAVDENGFVMVADRDNSRILLFDSELEFKGEILSKEKHDLRHPMRIVLD